MLVVETGYTGKIEIESLNASFKLDRDSILSFDNPKKFKVIQKLKMKRLLKIVFLNIQLK